MTIQLSSASAKFLALVDLQFLSGTFSVAPKYRAPIVFQGDPVRQEHTLTKDWVTGWMGARVLCIDDEVLGLEIRKVVFERAGYTVLTASEGNAAIKVFLENQVDAVVLDYAMPGMNGSQVARALRQIKPEVPILLLSAYLSLPDDAQKWVDLIVNKGDGAPTLLRRVEELLAGKSGRER